MEISSEFWNIKERGKKKETERNFSQRYDTSEKGECQKDT